MSFIEKYLDSNIYSSFYVPSEGEAIFFVKEVNGQKLLHQLDLTKSQSLENANCAFSEDLNSRSIRPQGFDSDADELYLIADVDHNEEYNLYKLRLKDQKLIQLTFVKFASSGLITDDFAYFYYGDRFDRGDGTFNTVFKELNLKTHEERDLFNDSEWEYRLSFGTPLMMSRDELLIPLNQNNLRNRTNLAHYNCKTQKVKLILSKEQECSFMVFLDKELRNGLAYFTSESNGFSNVYSYNSVTEEVVQLTQLEQRNNGLEILEEPGQPAVIVALLPDLAKEQTQIQSFTLTGELLDDWILAGDHSLVRNKNQLWLHHASFTSLPHLQKYQRSSRDELFDIQLVQGDSDKLVHCESCEYIEYESVDGLKIPALLARPKTEIKAAIIVAFYGGHNEYYAQYQMFLEQGIAVLSPAVRGSWGWGKAWENKLKGDLGGHEILDLVAAARFLEKKLGLTPVQIGLEGGSHGGYATLRGLTLPENYLGYSDTKYPFGFGVCWAGFADLVKFHETSWIADWLVDLLGPMETNLDKYKERSPINDFDQLQAPLYVVHGTHDRRVPPETMTGFLVRLGESEVVHRIHYVQGQGHTGGAKKEKLAQYLGQFDFLTEIGVLKELQ